MYPARSDSTHPRRSRPRSYRTIVRRRILQAVRWGTQRRTDTHWPVETNAKTHNFWVFRAFVNRPACTVEEYRKPVKVRSEAWKSQQCPDCGLIEDTKRHRGSLTCLCKSEVHANLTASETFLRRHQNPKSSDRRTRHRASRQQLKTVIRSIARPVCLRNNHEWLEPSHSHRPNEEYTSFLHVHIGEAAVDSTSEYVRSRLVPSASSRLY